MPKSVCFTVTQSYGGVTAKPIWPKFGKRVENVPGGRRRIIFIVQRGGDTGLLIFSVRNKKTATNPNKKN